MEFAQLLGRVGGDKSVQGQNCPRDLHLKLSWCEWQLEACPSSPEEALRPLMLLVQSGEGMGNDVTWASAVRSQTSH